MASIYSIMYMPEGSKYGPAHGDYIRRPLKRARLVAGHGIEGDAKGGHNPDRSLNLLSLDWLAVMAPQGFRTEPGQMGEQIILEGVAPEALAAGARLLLGTQAVIQISKPRTPCERFEASQRRSHEGVPFVGVMARVLAGGEIAVGDAVRVVEASA